MNIRGLGNDPRFGDRRHVLQGRHTARNQSLRVDVHPISCLLLDLLPQLQELRRDDYLLVQPHNHITGSIPNGRLAVCFGNDLLKAASGGFILLRKVQRSGFQRLLHGVLDLAAAGNIALLLKVGHQLLGVLVADLLFLGDRFCVGRSGKSRCGNAAGR